MFDWNDEEVGDVIWGEASERNDHIVPYPKGNEEKPLDIFGKHCKKECSQEVNSVKFAENISDAKNESLGTKLESSSRLNTDGLPTPEFEMNSWVETEISGLDSAKGDHAQLDNGLGLFGNDYEDKQNGGFLDDSWTNIGNFDDFDRIFRNEDPVFRCGSLGNADELWSSSADVFSSTTKHLSMSVDSPTSGINAFGRVSENCEVKAEAFPQKDPSVTHGQRGKSHACSHVLMNVDLSKDKAAGNDSCSFSDPVIKHAAGKSMPIVDEKIYAKLVEKTRAFNSHSQSTSKVNGKRKPLQFLKKEENSGKSSEGLSDDCFMTANQFPQFGSQFTTSTIQTFPSSVLSPQRQPPEPESLMYLPTTHPCLFSGNGNHTHHSPVMAMLPCVHSEKDKHHADLAGYEFPLESPKPENPWKEFPVPLGPLTMTPQEKLEKLRRRQQMQAMLAIQEQQQQFVQQVPCIDHSNAEKCLQENRSQDREYSGIEVDENLKAPLLGPNSPQKKDDSHTISMVIDNCSLAESVLDQLQEVITKLDIKIRFCIRDSLLRLAHNSIQRNNASDTSSTNNSKVEIRTTAGGETDIRFPRMPDAETETNPIDRTVAYLLFHRPTELSGIAVKDEMLESPSTELMIEPRDMDQFQISDCINTPESNSNAETVYGGAMEV